MSAIPDILTALDDLPRPCCLLDANGHPSWTNSAFQEFAGRSSRKLRQTHFREIFADGEDIDDHLLRVSTENAPLVLRDARLTTGKAEVMLFPTSGKVGVLISPERATTSRAMHGRSVKSLGQMIGHELKNPLAGIKGAAQLLRQDVSSTDALSLLEIISSEIDRIRRLADRLQSFGDFDATETKRINIHTLLRNARKIMAASAPDILFTEDYDPSLPHLEGDSDQLMQVLINLIKNAIEAMGGEGHITLKTGSRSGARRENTVLPIEVQIIDDGPGLPPHMLGRAFEPFVTTKPSGQGLGLALVANVIEAHGGLVEVDSRPGSTRFSLLLPAAKPDPKDE